MGHRSVSPQIAHQWSLEKLLLCLINMEEWPSATGESSHLEKLVLETPFLEALPPSFGRDLRNLKYLELRSCHSLTRLPDSFLLMDQLIKLIVEDCPLQELHFETVEGGSETMTMTHSEGQGTVSNLERRLLPTGVCPDLQDLDIRNCNDLEEVTFPKALINLKLYNCSKLRQIAASSSMGVCPNLQDFDIRFCQDLVEVTLPNVPKMLTFYKCSNLRKVDASFSTGVCDIRECEDLAEVMTLQSAHERLIISNFHKLRKIGGSFPSGVYPKVQYLFVQHCENLGELEMLPTALEHLRIEECEELVEVGTLPNAVIKLQLIDCPKLKKIERLCGFAKLQTLNVSRRKDVEELPSIEGKSERLAESRGERALSNLDFSFDKCLLCLQHLELHNTAISEVSFPTGVCPNLQHLDIKDCKDLIEVRTLPNPLIKLQLYDCPKLKLMSIADLAQVMQLREIRVHLCTLQCVRRAARRWIFDVLAGDAGTWMYEVEKHNGFGTADTAPRTRRFQLL